MSKRYARGGHTSTRYELTPNLKMMSGSAPESASENDLITPESRAAESRISGRFEPYWLAGTKAGTRAYNRGMKELAAEDATRREGQLSKITSFFISSREDTGVA